MSETVGCECLVSHIGISNIFIYSHELWQDSISTSTKSEQVFPLLSLSFSFWFCSFWLSLLQKFFFLPDHFHFLLWFPHFETSHTGTLIISTVPPPFYLSPSLFIHRYIFFSLSSWCGGQPARWRFLQRHCDKVLPLRHRPLCRFALSDLKNVEPQNGDDNSRTHVVLRHRTATHPKTVAYLLLLMTVALLGGCTVFPSWSSAFQQCHIPKTCS